MDINGLVTEIISRSNGNERYIIAICGAPGAGKSTLAKELAGLLNEQGKGNAVVVPMDGFHLDDEILDARGLRPRKGAPKTFDADGFFHTLSRIREHRHDVFIPLFDRTLELSRAAAEIIKQSDRFVVVEGNYLLLDRNPWADLKSQFDFTIFLDVDSKELEKRSIARWLHFDYTLEQAHEKCHSNDMLNAQTVINNSTTADLVIKNQ